MTKVGDVVIIPVRHSSHVVGLGYDVRRRRLYVEYNTMAVWSYEPISKAQWSMIAQVPSKGTAIHAVKRAPGIEARRVPDNEITR